MLRFSVLFILMKQFHQYKNEFIIINRQLEIDYNNINFIIYPSMQIQQPNLRNQISLRSFNDIEIEPSSIHSLFHCIEDNNLYVSKEKTTEVYHITSDTRSSPTFHHIATLPWSKYSLNINSIILLFCPFELKYFSNNSWQTHPFTTELISINVKKVSPSLTIVYSFHQQQTVEYRFSNNQDDQQLTINYLPKGKSPFHINRQNNLEGFGKQISLNQKNNLLTVSDYKNQDYVVTGDSDGSLHIYDFRTLGHLKSFKRHLGPILALKIDEENDVIFFSGSDSKVAAVKRFNDQWVLSGEIRGQSHDIFSLQLVGSTLISGGITTDICCYPIQGTKQILSGYENKISYNSDNVIHAMKNYLLVNKITSFQLWKINQTKTDLDFLVRYQMPNQKFIKDIKISKKVADKSNLIIVSSEIDTVGWKFDQQNGLVKLFTIKNSYQFIEFLPNKMIFVGLRDNGQIQKVNCKTGKITLTIESGLALPTDMKLLSNQKLIISSNLTNQLKVFDLKQKCPVSKFDLPNKYQVICEKSQTEFLIKYVGDNQLYACNFQKKLIQQTSILSLSQNSNFRYGGVIVHQSQITKNLKKYWYFATQNKVFLINNLNNPNKKKSIRSIFTRRIGTIFKPKLSKAFEIGMVHLNFRRLINNLEIKPLINKKIL